MPEDSPIINQGAVTPYDFNSQQERNNVGNYNLKVFNFSKGYGGTLTLGGTTNGNGLMILKDETGGTIFTGDNLGHHYYGTSGTELIRIDSEGLSAFGNTGNPINIYPLGGTTPYFVMGYNVAQNYVSLTTLLGGGDFTTGQLHLASYKGPSIDIGSGLLNQELSFYSASLINLQSDVYITGDMDIDGTITGTITNAGSASYAGTASYAYQSGTAQYAVSGGGGGTADYAYAAGELVDLFDSGNVITAYKDGSDIKFFSLSGTIIKTAIVPTSKGYRALYTNESPNVWFMDFCESKDKIDPLFLEVTEPPYHFIKCEDGEYQVWGIRKGLKNKRFEEKTKEEFDRNNQFWSMAQYKKFDDKNNQLLEKTKEIKNKAFKNKQIDV